MPTKAFLHKKSLLDQFKDDHKSTGYIQSARAEHTWNNPLTRRKRTNKLNGWIKSFQGKRHVHKLARFNAMQNENLEEAMSLKGFLSNLNDKLVNKYGLDKNKVQNYLNSHTQEMQELLDDKELSLKEKVLFVRSEITGEKDEAKKSERLFNKRKMERIALSEGSKVSPYLVEIAHKILTDEYGWKASTIEEVADWLGDHKQAFEHAYGQALRDSNDDKANVRAGIEAVLDEEERGVMSAEIAMMGESKKSEFYMDGDDSEDYYYCHRCGRVTPSYELDAHGGFCSDCDARWTAEHENESKDTDEKLGYEKGHKNSKGEDAPWVIRSHEDNRVLASFPTKKEAEDQMQRMKQYSKQEAYVDNSATAQKDYIERVISAVQDYYGYSLFDAKNLVQRNAKKVKDWYMSGEVSDVEAARCLGGNCEPTKKESKNESAATEEDAIRKAFKSIVEHVPANEKSNFDEEFVNENMEALLDLFNRWFEFDDGEFVTTVRVVDPDNENGDCYDEEDEAYQWNACYNVTEGIIDLLGWNYGEETVKQPIQDALFYDFIGTKYIDKSNESKTSKKESKNEASDIDSYISDVISDLVASFHYGKDDAKKLVEQNSDPIRDNYVDGDMSAYETARAIAKADGNKYAQEEAKKSEKNSDPLELDLEEAADAINSRLNKNYSGETRNRITLDTNSFREWNQTSPTVVLKLSIDGKEAFEITCHDDEYSVESLINGEDGEYTSGSLADDFAEDGLVDLATYIYTTNLDGIDRLLGVKSESHKGKPWMVEWRGTDGNHEKEYFGTKQDAQKFYDDHYGADGIEALEEPVNTAKKSEADGDTDVFTIDLFRIDDDGNEDAFNDMQAAQTFYDEDEAIKVANELADSYAGEDGVVFAVVMAGEREKPNGDIVGEPFDIHWASSGNPEKTAEYRKKAGYAASGNAMDYYAKQTESKKLEGIHLDFEDTLQVPEWLWRAYLLNDTTDLEEDEIEKLNDFREKYKNYHLDDKSEDPYFSSRNDFDELGGNVYGVDVYKMSDEPNEKKNEAYVDVIESPGARKIVKTFDWTCKKCGKPGARIADYDKDGNRVPGFFCNDCYKKMLNDEKSESIKDFPTNTGYKFTFGFQNPKTANVAMDVAKEKGYACEQGRGTGFDDYSNVSIWVSEPQDAIRFADAIVNVANEDERVKLERSDIDKAFALAVTNKGYSENKETIDNAAAEYAVVVHPFESFNGFSAMGELTDVVDFLESIK